MPQIQMDRIFGQILRYLFVLCIPLLVLSSSIHAVAGTRDVYEYGFSKYNVAETTELSEEQLSKIASKLLSYLQGDATTPQLVVTTGSGAQFPLFHAYELVHLADVRWLFELNRRLLLLAVLSIATYVLWHVLKEQGEWTQVASGALCGSIITVGLLTVIGLAGLIDFRGLFVLFHALSFDNPFWLLDPSKDYLIMLFPAGFWQDVALLTGALTGTKALFLGGTAWALLRRRQSIRSYDSATVT